MKPPVDSDGGKEAGPLPQVTFMSLVSSSSTRLPFWKTSHSRKQLDLYDSPLTFTLYSLILVRDLGSIDAYEP